MQVGNLYIKKFKKGLQIRMKGQEPINIDNTLASVMACHIRDYSSPRVFTFPEVERMLVLKKVDESFSDFVKRYDSMSYKEVWGE